MTDAEVAQLGSYFKYMGVKPKVDSQTDFEEWIKSKAGSLTDTKPSKGDTPIYLSDSLQQFLIISASYEVWRNEMECIRLEGHKEQAVA